MRVWTEGMEDSLWLSCSFWPGPATCLLIVAPGDLAYFPKQVPVQTPRPSPGLWQLHRGCLYTPSPHLASQGTAFPVKGIHAGTPMEPSQQVEEWKRKRISQIHFVLLCVPKLLSWQVTFLHCFVWSHKVSSDPHIQQQQQHPRYVLQFYITFKLFYITSKHQL